MSKCQIVGNLMHWLKFIIATGDPYSWTAFELMKETVDGLAKILNPSCLPKDLNKQCTVNVLKFRTL